MTGRKVTMTVRGKTVKKAKTAGELLPEASKRLKPGETAVIHDGFNRIEFKKKESKTTQRTIRLPRDIEEALESETQDSDVSVPGAIVQILEAWYKFRMPLRGK